MKKLSTITLPADFCFNSSIRKIAQDIFHTAGFLDQDESRLTLVFDEIFMNAIRYGSKNDSMLHIRFEWEKDKWISVSIEDEGGNSKTSSKEVKEKLKNELMNNDITKTSGRGLAQITKKIVDQLSIEESKYGGIAVTFKKNI